MDTLSSYGVTGVSLLIDECYKNVNQPPTKKIMQCLAFDAVASHIIPIMEKENNFPITPKFGRSVYRKRTKAALEKINIITISDQDKAVNMLEYEAVIALEFILK